MQQTILLVENDSARGKRLEFLLRLADYQVRHFVSVEEAINWRLTCSARYETGICLLLGTPGPVVELATLLQQLHSRVLDLPVLLVNRDLPSFTVRRDGRRQLACLGVHVCVPTEISATLAAIFRQDRSLLSWSKERTLPPTEASV
ncbi:MAG TPA: hypothetical protein DEB35_06340 [Desulfuromonas sp.]|nr:hypothetical protein [Desulfuromonas sp.]